MLVSWLVYAQTMCLTVINIKYISSKLVASSCKKQDVYACMPLGLAATAISH